MPSITIAGDLCPVGRNELLLCNGEAAQILGDIQHVFEIADLVIANLECPLIERITPITKLGPNLGVSPDCARGLKAMGVDVAVLANNHMMDHGPTGLDSTLRTLEVRGIAAVGAGENLASARRILVREAGGIRIGILAMAEHEFGIAGAETPGVNPLDVISFVRQVAAQRDEFDQLIAILHVGNEYFPFPRPGLLDTCRFLVEQGAAAVICQHSHCVGCMEMYQGAPILYGQGNFLFDWDSPHPSFYEGMLLKLELNLGGIADVTTIPFTQSRPVEGIRPMGPSQENDFQASLEARNRMLRDPAALDGAWRDYCRRNRTLYLNGIHGKATLLRRAAAKLGLLDYLTPRSVHLHRLNYISCESHREALIDILTGEARV